MTKGITEELVDIFELSGASSHDTTTANDPTFYKTLSNSDFLKHFDLVLKDHRDFTKPSIITLKCKAIKKFLAYEGFYPAQRTVDIYNQFMSSFRGCYAALGQMGSPFSTANNDGLTSSIEAQALIEPLFAPGLLFNTIKSGVAVDWPTIYHNDGLITGSYDATNALNRRSVDFLTAQGIKPNPMEYMNQYMISSSNNLNIESGSWSIWSERIPFEALIDPYRYLGRKEFQMLCGLTRVSALLPAVFNKVYHQPSFSKMGTLYTVK